MIWSDFASNLIVQVHVMSWFWHGGKMRYLESSWEGVGMEGDCTLLYTRTCYCKKFCLLPQEIEIFQPCGLASSLGQMNLLFETKFASLCNLHLKTILLLIC